MSPPQQNALILPEKQGQYVVGSRAVPHPGPGQVLIKVHAAGMNGIDNFLQRTGLFLQEYPAVTGHEGSGVVEELGEGVTEVAVGDRVLFETMLTPDSGSYQQYCLGLADRVVKFPDTLSFEEAATLPVNFATAALSLFKEKSVRANNHNERGGAGLYPLWEEGGAGKYAGEPFVLLGGSSGVGQLTLQVAKLMGFDPIISTCSQHNIEYVKAAGATHVIDYAAVPYASLPEAVRKITQKPVTIVFDAISVEETQNAGWAVLAPGGSIVVMLHPYVGNWGAEAEDGKRTVWPFANVNLPEHRVFGKLVYEKLGEYLQKGIIKPTRHEVLPGGLHGAFAGLERLATGKVSGVKLVVHPQDTPDAAPN